MTPKQPLPEDMRHLCGEISPEDGMDPREFARKGRPRKGDRKLRQLCSQVSETLALVLSGECGDDVLRNLHVVAVDPAPDASQLVVTVTSAIPEESLDQNDTMERLMQAMGKLRCAVAGAVTRKRAPKLVFRVV
jgi:ribosome-binding factor A